MKMITQIKHLMILLIKMITTIQVIMETVILIIYVSMEFQMKMITKF
jgi:hypothetical protein